MSARSREKKAKRREKRKARAARLEGRELAKAVQRREPKAKRRRDQRDRSPHGWFLAQLAKGVPAWRVVEQLCGACSLGRLWTRWFMSHFRECKTEKSRRRLLAEWLRMWDQPEFYDGEWVVRDKRGYIGRQHEEQWREVADKETGEIKLKKVLVHVPAENAGGLAAHHQSAPRTCTTYRTQMRSGETPLLRSNKTPPKEHAVMPKRKGATWAYAFNTLPARPSAAMRRRWGEPADFEQYDLDLHDPFDFPWTGRDEVEELEKKLAHARELNALAEEIPF